MRNGGTNVAPKFEVVHLNDKEFADAAMSVPHVGDAVRADGVGKLGNRLGNAQLLRLPKRLSHQSRKRVLLLLGCGLRKIQNTRRNIHQRNTHQPQ